MPRRLSHFPYIPMTTKPPSSVKSAPEQALEKIAYAVAADIPTADPHDRDRIGYNVWRYLTQKKDPLEVAVKTAGARLLIPEDEVVERIRKGLQERGIEV